MKNTSFSLILILLTLTTVQAQPNFTRDLNTRPINARSMALGNATASTTFDASAMFINPGSIGRIKKLQFMITPDFQVPLGSLKENQSVPNYSRSAISKNSPQFQLNQVCLAFPVGEHFAIAAGMAKLSNFNRFKEDWEITLSNGSATAYDRISYDYHGGSNIAGIGIGTRTSFNMYGNSLTGGLTIGRIFGTRTSSYVKEFINGGVTQSHTEMKEELRYSGTQVQCGLTFKTRSYRRYNDETEKIMVELLGDDYKKKQPKDTAMSSLFVSLSGTLPYYRKNNVISSTSMIPGTNSYTYKPGTIILSIGYKIVHEIGGIYGGYDPEDYKAIMPVLQYEMTRLDNNQVLIPLMHSADNGLPNMNSNRLGFGLEFINTEATVTPRVGISFVNYAINNPVGSSNAGKQTSAVALGTGLGNDNFDLALRLEFFRSPKVLVYSNNSGIDYNGVILGLMYSQKI